MFGTQNTVPGTCIRVCTHMYVMYEMYVMYAYQNSRKLMFTNDRTFIFLCVCVYWLHVVTGGAKQISSRSSVLTIQRLKAIHSLYILHQYIHDTHTHVGYPVVWWCGEMYLCTLPGTYGT